MIVDKIYAYLSSEKKELNEALLQEVAQVSRNAFERQFMGEPFTSKNLRLSSSGKCARQQAYGLHGYEIKGKEIDSRAKLVFFFGDFAEMAIVALAKLSGVELTETGVNQRTVKIKVGEHEINGHPDGFLKDFLFEAKSMTSRSFSDFEKGIIEESYLAQANLYLEGCGLDKEIMVALNKESGVLGEQVITKNPEIVKATIKNLESVLNSTKENLPERKYEPNLLGYLPWNCLYCSYWGHCWPEAKKVVVSKKYKLRIQPKEVLNDTPRD